MNVSKIFKIKGMHCASCAGIIEKAFKKTEGVTSRSKLWDRNGKNCF